MARCSNRFIKLLLHIPLGAAGFFTAFCAYGAGFDWQRDCVGAFSLELPGASDVAMPPQDRFLNAFNYIHLPYRFEADSEYSQVWGSTQSVGGFLVTGPSATPEQFERLKSAMDERYAANKRMVEDEFGDPEQATHIRLGHPEFEDAYQWDWGEAKHFLLRRGSRIFSVINPGKDDQYYAPWVRHVAKSVRSRKLFDVPSEPGLCLHYGFLPGGTTTTRNIGVTYRLKDHPEIEILFRDSSALRTQEGQKEKSAAQEVQFFWEDDNPVRGKQVRLLSPHVPGMMQFPDVKMGGFTGKRSFVEITRQNGTVDYGYMAFVKGDPSAKDDKPDLLLYVIRDASKAKGKPLDRSEVEAIAGRIAASVERRKP